MSPIRNGLAAAALIVAAVVVVPVTPVAPSTRAIASEALVPSRSPGADRDADELSATSRSLRFRLRIANAAQRRVAVDSLYVSVLSAAGRRLATLAIYSNRDAGLFGVSREVRVPIPPRYAQAGNRIAFERERDDRPTTTFLVDDVSVD